MVCFNLQDNTLAVWDMKSPTDIKLRRVLDGDWHFWAVEVDEKYIYGSQECDIKVPICKFSSTEIILSLRVFARVIHVCNHTSYIPIFNLTLSVPFCLVHVVCKQFAGDETSN